MVLQVNTFRYPEEFGVSVRRLLVVSYPRSFRTQAIRTQTQMILMVRTQATGFYVPILFAVEIRFHQPKQRFTCICGGTLNPGQGRYHVW